MTHFDGPDKVRRALWKLYVVLEIRSRKLINEKGTNQKQLETSGLGLRSSSQDLRPELVEIDDQVHPEYHGTSTSCVV